MIYSQKKIFSTKSDTRSFNILSTDETRRQGALKFKYYQCLMAHELHFREHRGRLFFLCKKLRKKQLLLHGVSKTRKLSMFEAIIMQQLVAAHRVI
jgi:hypothetical protein